MVIVNSKENIPSRFFQIELSRFRGWLSQKFLERIVTPGYNAGIKRNNYYLIKVDALYRFSEDTPEAQIFMNLMLGCISKGFNYLMITL